MGANSRRAKNALSTYIILQYRFSGRIHGLSQWHSPHWAERLILPSRCSEEIFRRSNNSWIAPCLVGPSGQPSTQFRRRWLSKRRKEKLFCSVDILDRMVPRPKTRFRGFYFLLPTPVQNLLAQDCIRISWRLFWQKWDNGSHLKQKRTNKCILKQCSWIQ